MKTVLGISGSVVGSVSFTAMINTVRHGWTTDTTVLLFCAAVFGCLNGVFIALARRHLRSFSETKTCYALVGACGMGLLYAEIYLCFASSAGTFSQQSTIMVIGSFCGLCYRTFASWR